MITAQSTLKEVLAHPIGHDVVAKLLMQLNISIKLIDNPILGRMTLGQLEKLGGRTLGSDFFETVYRLLNQEAQSAPIIEGGVKHKWWKEAVFYQIYPRSFKDSNGDGIGDLRGIISKLDYLQELGIDALWLSPIYDSPGDDNGYDIRDYHKILEDFGTMSDFEELVTQLKKRDMRLIMDLVVNHTSDEHEWFQQALSDPQGPYHDYYLFQEKPNNWVSFFSGPAWRYLEETQEWVLHLFSNKQIDLNWRNPSVRTEVQNIVHYWREKGVDGFRLDVINYISKPDKLDDGNQKIGELMGYTGIEKYYYGPHLHEYLHELNVKAFKDYDLLSVGETPGVGLEMARLLTHEDRQELDTVFLFDHLETPGHVRWDDYQYDLGFLKTYYQDLYSVFTHHEWPSLFIENHDNPRMISKVSKDLSHRDKVGKLLATLMLTLKGTPFIYQGQELGLINHEFQSIADMRDVESINKFEELSDLGEELAFKTVLAGSRDHSRVGMPWREGFSSGKPWIENFSPLTITDETEIDNPDSIYHWYKDLIKLRKESATFIYGEIEFVYPNKKNYLGYYRRDNDQTFFVEINCSEKSTKRYVDTNRYQRLMSNMKYHLDKLSGYEVNIYLVKE